MFGSELAVFFSGHLVTFSWGSISGAFTQISIESCVIRDSSTVCQLFPQNIAATGVTMYFNDTTEGNYELSILVYQHQELVVRKLFTSPSSKCHSFVTCCLCKQRPICFCLINDEKIEI